MAFSDAQTMTGSHGMQHDAQATAMLTKAIVYAPIGQASRAEQIIERLSNAIVSGLLQDEEQLPNEAELSRLLGVSPMTVREALNTLRVRGLIDTRRGRHGGSFVSRRSLQTLLSHHPLRLLASDYLADLGEYHLAVAGHSAKLATQRATPAELARFATLVEDFAQADTAQTRAQADMRCLLALAGQAQSARLANQMLEVQAEWAPLVALLYDRPDTHAESVRSYRSVCSAMASGDDRLARELMQHGIATLTDDLLACKLQLDAAAPSSSTPPPAS